MFTIETDEHTARAVFRKPWPVIVAEHVDYHTAREIARAISASTSGRFLVVPPEGSPIATEAFGSGVSEGNVE